MDSEPENFREGIIEIKRNLRIIKIKLSSVMFLVKNYVPSPYTKDNFENINSKMLEIMEFSTELWQFMEDLLQINPNNPDLNLCLNKMSIISQIATDIEVEFDKKTSHRNLNRIENKYKILYSRISNLSCLVDDYVISELVYMNPKKSEEIETQLKECYSLYDKLLKSLTYLKDEVDSAQNFELYFNCNKEDVYKAFATISIYDNKIKQLKKKYETRGIEEKIKNGDIVFKFL